jgi:hypothetical protein
VISRDETIQQLYGMANETVEELNERYKWPQLITRLTFNHADASGYGALKVSGDSATVADWRNLQPGTLWDATAGLELVGPLTDEEWESAVVLDISAGRYMYRFWGDYLRIFPVPDPVGDTDFSLEYYSSGLIYAADGATVKDSFTADTDFPRVPSRLITLGMRWRYKKEKGLPYAEDKDTYELAIQDQQSNTGNEKTLDMGAAPLKPGPMIIVPPGSWPV